MDNYLYGGQSEGRFLKDYKIKNKQELSETEQKERVLYENIYKNYKNPETPKKEIEIEDPK